MKLRVTLTLTPVQLREAAEDYLWKARIYDKMASALEELGGDPSMIDAEIKNLRGRAEDIRRYLQQSQG